MKKITFLLIALLVAMVSYSQVFFEENFNGTVQPANWFNFVQPAHGTQIWEFGSGVTPGTDIADFSSNAAIFDDPTGVNVAYLYHFPVDITTIMNDVDYALIYTIRTSLNTFGSDPNPDRLSINVSDEDFSLSNHIIWHTNTEHNPTKRIFDIKTFLEASSWNLDYSEFRIGVEFNDMDGTNGWGAGIDDVSFYARQYNDDSYASLLSRYVISSLPYEYTQKADNQVNFNESSYESNISGTHHMANGLWYKYTADFTGLLTVQAQAFDYDVEVGAYEYNSSDSKYHHIGGADDGFGGELETLVITVVNGRSYYFNVGHWSSNASASDMHGEQFIKVTNPTAGIEDNVILGLEIYPNPVTDLLNIRSQEEITKIKIYNQLGQLLKTVQAQQANTKIDVSDLDLGLYLVQIEASNKTTTKKFLKNDNSIE